MQGMRDKKYDLAICDPPYGIGDRFKGGKSGKMQFNEIVNKAWDKSPTSEYFDEIMRVSINQIIWGGNYFDLPPTRCFLVWDKVISEDFSLAMVEMAWTSFDALAKLKRLPTPKNGKIHPTQKPVALYRWLLKNYAKPNDTILDTHLGSGSICIACHDLGFHITGFELDEEYLSAAVNRIKNYLKQPKLFKPEVKLQEQEVMF